MRLIYIIKMFLISALLALIGTGCASTRAPSFESPFVIRETVHRDTTVYLPGATVWDTLRIPSLYTGERVRDTIFREYERTVYDPDTRARLTIAMNAIGTLRAKCEALPDTIYIPKIETQTVALIEHKARDELKS